MDIVTRAIEIVHDLTLHVGLFRGWAFTVETRILEQTDGENTSALVHFDVDVKRAKIWIDPRFPHDEETYTLDELIAHELGHIVCGEPVVDEPAATRAGLLLLQWARERENCKCGQ